MWSKENREKNFVSSTCLLQIDIDSKDNEHIFEDAHKVATLHEKLMSDPFVVFVCKSPTNAIKAAIHYNYDDDHKAAFEKDEQSFKDEHKAAYKKAEKYFKNEYGVNIDKQCKDINRALKIALANFFTFLMYKFVWKLVKRKLFSVFHNVWL